MPSRQCSPSDFSILELGRRTGVFCLLFGICKPDSHAPDFQSFKVNSMNLGTFSISLAVKDIEASRAFYGHMGFEVVGGDASQNWLILRNADHTIGLFQGMFEKNILTFNPGWDKEGNSAEEFTDVRDLQRELKSKGIEPVTEADEDSQGPASCILEDPDGNQILLDQHV